MVVAKQIANPALGRQHKITLSVTKSAPSLYTLHSTPYTNKRFEKTIEHIIPLPPAPRRRHLLRVRANRGCRGAVCGYGVQR